MGKWESTVGAGFGTGKHQGETKDHPVIDERDGSIGGKHVEHWDGSQDAVITPKTVGARTKAGDER